MTREEKLALLGKAEGVAFASLANISEEDVKGNVLAQILYGIRELGATREVVVYAEEPDAEEEIRSVTTPTVVIPFPAQGNDNGVKSPDPVPDPETEEDPGMTKDELRCALSALSTKYDLNVSEVMKSLGYDKLSEVPVKQYRALLTAATGACSKGGVGQ